MDQIPFFVDEDLVKFVLNGIQGDCIELDQSYQITKEIVKDDIELCSIGPILAMKYVWNKDIENLTGIVSYQ